MGANYNRHFRSTLWIGLIFVSGYKPDCLCNCVHRRCIYFLNYVSTFFLSLFFFPLQYLLVYILLRTFHSFDIILTCCIFSNWLFFQTFSYIFKVPVDNHLCKSSIGVNIVTSVYRFIIFNVHENSQDSNGHDIQLGPFGLCFLSFLP